MIFRHTLSVATLLVLASNLIWAKKAPIAVTGSRSVEAGDIVELTVTISEMLHAIPEVVDITFRGPAYDATVGVDPKAGDSTYRLRLKAPSGGTGRWKVRDATLWFAGNKTPMTVSLTDYSFDIIPNNRSAGAERRGRPLNSDQVKLLQGEERRIRDGLDEFKKEADEVPDDRSFKSLVGSTLDFWEARLRRTEGAFHALAPEEGLDDSAVPFFDLRTDYEEAKRCIELNWKISITLGIPVPRRCVPSKTGGSTEGTGGLAFYGKSSNHVWVAQLLSFALLANADAYKVIAGSEDTTFSLSVSSTPQGAMISCWRRGYGDECAKNTDTEIKFLPYAIWYLRLKLAGYKTKEVRYDPYTDTHLAVHEDLDPVEK